MLTLQRNIAAGQALGIGWSRQKVTVSALKPYRNSQKIPPAEEARMSVKVSMKVNGKAVSAELEPRTLLVTYIREHLRLTGTHVGCDTAQCGACTVLMNGKAIKSCSIVAMQAEGADIMTIEGVAKPDGTLHPMQAAFKENHGLQCGFCTPGMVMNALDFAKSHPNPTEQEVRESLEGNLCRCTGYHNIVKSIVAGAKAMGNESKQQGGKL
jgi:carbon-monoxide dehydrogenase small subunit